jgi:amidohydrolase
MDIPAPILEAAAQLRAIRHQLHSQPELCFEEHQTSELIAQYLTEWEIPVLRGLGGTGVVGILKNGNSKRAVGLRADMDALPVQELNAFAHASRNPGRMHACGHDGHMAMLLGAARYLSSHRNFDGTIYLIFQPAEEGGGGALQMMRDGLFSKCPVDAVFGMHNWPGIPEGHFAVTPGPMMASSNEFEVVISGKGAHAAQPHKGIDPVIVATHVVQAWQSIVTRNINPLENVVLSVTQIHAGSTTNVIPDQATLVGTVRTFKDDVLDTMESRMEQIASHVATAFGARANFNFKRNYPPLINHPRETEFAIGVMQSLVGPARVDTEVEPSMGAEDFAFMLQEMPGCYVFIGNGEGGHREQGHGLGPCNLHNGSYDFNDRLLPLGSAYWVKLAETFLSA